MNHIAKAYRESATQSRAQAHRWASLAYRSRQTRAKAVRLFSVLAAANTILAVAWHGMWMSRVFVAIASLAVICKVSVWLSLTGTIRVSRKGKRDMAELAAKCEKIARELEERHWE